jgi:tetratricopeptide (TPR) repeat protein/predicted Ser/Thr protein kinase
MTKRPELLGPLALQLRDAVREDLERRFGELCVSRGVLSSADLRRGLEEQKRLRDEGADASLVHALTRLGLVDGGGPLWPLFDEVLASPVEVPAPGGRLGRYELIGEVGKGGSGTVYKAYDTTLHRIVAVKTITSTLAEPAELVRSLVREAQTLAGLSHKNIVAVYDAGEIDGTPFLCMEFVEGLPLGERMRRSGALLPLFRKVADALAHAHAQGIVHCDLKPGNILVDQDGEPRIIDFGLARALGRRRGSGPEGTPAYMAPEQVRCDPGAAGPQVDVYSLGVCLYEALTGVRPFDGDSPQGIFDRILAGDVVPPRARRPQIPRELERICLKAMAADPKRRYARAADFAADLGRALEARPKTPRRWIAVGLALAALLLGVGIVSHDRAEGERQIERRLDERVKPLELLIVETRPFFYIKDADVAGRLAKVRASLMELERLAEDPRFAAHADLWRALGAGQYFVGDTRRSEESLGRAAALAPGDGAIHYYLGRLYLDWAILELLTPPPGAEARERSRAWNQKAEEQLSRAATWEGAAELDRRLAEACLAFSKDDAVAAERICREGLDRFAGKLGVEEFSRLLAVLSPPGERLGHLNRAIEFRPHYPWALVQRGGQHLLDGKFDAAIEDLDRTIALYPQLPEAFNNRGVGRLGKGELDAAIADFDEALRLNPKNAPAWGNRALARAGKKDIAGALEDGTRAIALSPFPGSMIYNRGVHRLQAGDPEGALLDVEEALKRDPSMAAAYSLRGKIRSGRKDWTAALADFEEALKRDPKQADALAWRGAARLALEDRSGARRDLDAAIRMQPTLAIAWFQRGSMNAEDGDLEAAIADLSEAIRNDPAPLAALISRGVAWESKSEFDKAVADYDEALRIDFRSFDALFNRGMTRLAQGKPAAAVKDLQGALQLAPADWNSRALAESSLQEARKQLSE